MSRFTPEQTEAVRRRQGSLLLAAAAGSGKTSVLVERFVRAVLDDGVAPTAILAITFTEKAAGELRARVRARFAELGAREAARETEGAWVSTVHGFCARVLRAHAVAAGLDPAFAVLDEGTARELRAEAWEAAFARWLDGGGEAALDVAAAYGPDRLRDAVAAAHDALRSAGATRPALPALPAAPDVGLARAMLADAQARAAAELQGARDGARVEAARAAVAAGEAFSTWSMPALCGPGCTAYLEAVAALAGAERDVRALAVARELDALLCAYADAYAERKRARGALDFDDLELRTRDLLRDRPALRRGYAGRFALVMVDEFQDTNPLQLELVDLLDRDDVFVVGDERQSIYGFRHADVEVFRRRARELGARDATLALQTNFRTRADVLAAVNAVFGAPELRAGRPEPTDPEPRVELLLTESEGWDEVELGALPAAPAWRRAEARLLAQRVRELVDAGHARPEDVVVLVRAMSSVPVFERALEDVGLPTLAVGGRGYWGRQVVRDLCGWLAALANPRDEVALHGVLASPLVGASTDALALLAEAGTGGAWRALEAAFLAPEPDGAVPGADLAERLAPGDRARLAAFAARFAHERAAAPRLGLDELLERVVEATGYDLHVLSLPGGERRLANLHKLLRLAADHEAAHGRDVRGLVDRATAELAADAREPDAPVELGGLKAVRLMTVHAAKGLEFPVVCVADLGRRPSGETPDLLVRGDDVGLRLVGLDGTSQQALAYPRLRERALAEAAEEEARILYVALTRARERLVLSGSVKLASWPNGGPTRPPVAWLAPALAPGVEAGLLGEEEPVRDVALPAPAADGAPPPRVRLRLNAPATVGRVLTAPAPGAAAGALPVAVPPGPTPPGEEAEPGPPPPETLSYSALSAWRQCGYRFYLQRVLRLPEERVPAEERRRDPATGALDLRLRGTLVHELLEDPSPDDELPARVEAVAARHGVELSEEEAADVAALARAGAASPLAARVAAAHAVQREHAFAFGLGPTTLTGIVDVLAEEPRGALVVDYKTDRLAPDDDAEAYVEDHYGIQRRIYALAVLRSGAPQVEVAYALLHRGDVVVAQTYAQADAAALEAELLELVAGPLSGDFAVAPEPHRGLCLTCPGRRALCSWDETMTLREHPAGVAKLGQER